MSANSGSANTGSWLSAHGRLWYDDRWYRIAWIVWPQSIGLLLFVTLWLHPAGQGFISWGKPAVETPQNPPPAQSKEPTAPPLTPPPVDVLAPCKTGENEDIIQACSSLLTSGTLRGTDIAYAYWHRAWAYHSTKQYQPAMNDYNRAISLASNLPEFYNDRGLLWVDLGNNERALQDYDQALLIKPDYALPFMNRGVALRNLKRSNEALAALSKAIELDPTLWWAFENRAFVYEDNSNWRAMYDDATKLIELKPDYNMGYEFRGHAYFESGQYQAAIVDFTKSIATDPEAIYGYRMRGRSYYFLNQFDDAARDFEAALRIDPKDETAISWNRELKRKQRR
jgi:tetratricopeptide (TPR) repeat protein